MRNQSCYQPDESNQAGTGNLPTSCESFPRGCSENCKGGPHAHRIIVLPLSDEDNGQKDHSHPDQRQRFRKTEFAWTNYFSPAEDRSRNNCDRPWKPPNEMHPDKLKSRHPVVATWDIGKRTKVVDPFDLNQLMQKTGEMQLGCDVPRHDQGDEDQYVGPMKEA